MQPTGFFFVLNWVLFDDDVGGGEEEVRGLLDELSVTASDWAPPSSYWDCEAESELEANGISSLMKSYQALAPATTSVHV